MMQHADWEDQHEGTLRFSESFCKCHIEKIFELEEKIRSLETKLIIAKTTIDQLLYPNAP